MNDILVVEDETVLARSIVGFLERRGFSARFAVDAASARTMFERQVPRLAILDYRLNEDDGLELLDWMRAADPQVQIVMMTGHGDIDVAVRAMKSGARDFLTKPAPLDSIAAIAGELMLDDFAGGLDLTGADRIVGRSAAANTLRKQIRKIAESGANGDRPGVLVMGPHGSGKTLVARALHECATGRKDGIAICDCATLGDSSSEQLAEAMRNAEGGTLVLRKIGRLAAEYQTSLARMINQADRAPALIATAEAPLAGPSGPDAFLPDLLFQIQVGWIDVPTLAERTADVLPIADFTARRLARGAGAPRPRFSPGARGKLLQHDWPGNVAELVNCVERAILFKEGDIIEESQIRPVRAAGRSDADVMPTLAELEIRAIRSALNRTDGNVSRAAEMLGISRDTLRYRMEKFDLPRQ